LWDAGTVLRRSMMGNDVWDSDFDRYGNSASAYAFRKPSRAELRRVTRTVDAFKPSEAGQGVDAPTGPGGVRPQRGADNLRIVLLVQRGHFG